MSEVFAPGDLSERGKQEYKDKAYPEAAETFAAAAVAYTAAGDPLSAAEMANNRSVALLQAGDFQGSLDAVEGTAEAFAAAGDIRRQAMALGNRGAALKELGQTEQAILAYQQASDLFGQIGEKEMRSAVLQSLSMLQARAGRQYEALASMNAGLETAEKPNLLKRFLKKLIEVPFRFLFRS